jgi:cytochrome b561
MSRLERDGRYSAVAMALHWVIALAVAWQLTLGFSLESIPRAERGAAMGIHKSLGITILLLTLVRLGWRFTHKPPPLQATMKPWEKLLARSTHWGFYALLIGAPLGGWAMTSASTRAPPIAYWGLFEWPKLPIGKSNALAEQLAAGHMIAAYLLVLVLVLHLAGVVKHMFGEEGDVLWRMVPFLRKPPEV